MAPYHIRKYQESDHKGVLALFSSGMTEHIPTTFHYMLRQPPVILFLLVVSLTIFLLTDSWLLMMVSSFTLLAFLWFLAIYTWRKYMAMCFHTDLADITRSYMNVHGSCFWVAESGGQVVGIVGALPVKNPPLQKQLQLRHLSVALEHRHKGTGKALVRTVLQFAEAQGYDEVVLSVSILQYAALSLYQWMGFQKTGHSFFTRISRLRNTPLIHLMYRLPCAQERGL
uniref:N-acetyltransferase domain-containing protein n=1 Tax=Sciurus vulgaris TaxID=55149 RepID=A0A8D2DM44_SCIVU